MTTTTPPPDRDHVRHRDHQHLDDEALVQRLAFELRGVVEGEVRFDPGSRHLYATDSSNYRQVPIGIVVPRSVDDVVVTVEVCRRHRVPITSRGAGTSLSGETTNVAVILDFSKYLNGVLEIDAERRLARVQPGVVLDVLRREAEQYDLTFGPDPSTHNRCTLGGMLGNNSCGVHSVMAGRTVDNVESLELLLYDGTRLTLGPITLEEWDEQARRDDRVGEIHRELRELVDRYGGLIRERFPDIPRRVSGYCLDQLLPDDDGRVNLARAVVGSEGTCGIVLEATLQLIDSPQARALVVLGYPSVFEAADHVEQILRSGPIGLEGLDDTLVRNMEEQQIHDEYLDLLPEGRGWLLVELAGGDADEAFRRAQRLTDELDRLDAPPSAEIYRDPDREYEVWKIRESGLGATSFVPGEPDRFSGWEDAAVHPRDVGRYLRGFHDLLDRYGYSASLYGHFGDGCVHCRISFDLVTTQGVDDYVAFTGEAAQLVVGYGGSLSGEHGDGQVRSELLPVMYGPELVEAFRGFKRLWDPDEGLNPGKLVDPYARDANLRLGPGYAPWEPDTHFTFPDDEGRFSRAALRCVGVGLCRREDDTATMCPSFNATQEEKHSTRGRARLLFEMLQPDSDLDGWRDGHVREALDLCLSCKGCKTDCPVDVDMATYKAEFMSHHYQGRLRPRAAYSLGLIHTWARAARFAPSLANHVLASPVGSLLKRLAGVAPQRPVPAFAPQTLTSWFRERGGSRVDGPEVVLFPDTFTDHLEPDIGRAAVEVLEELGWHVRLPEQAVCCARPTFDFGLLDLAERELTGLTEVLGPPAADGVPVVGLEPSCVASLRDELPALLGQDSAGETIAEHTYTFAEFLTQVADWEPPRIGGRAMMHTHCHHQAIMGHEADQRLLDDLGIDWRDSDAGCCGLAGSFGFEEGEKYEVSVAVAEQRYLPRMGGAERDAFLLADGFSCRTQLRHLDGRRQPYHLAQLVAAALREGDVAPDGPAPPRTDAPLSTRERVAIGAAGAVVGAAVARQLVDQDRQA